MTAFIRQEAMEKANEIRLKADEEFAIEKSKLVRQETSSIDSSYEKKFKQASMSQQITRSTVSNKSRLRILSARQELLDRLFEDAGKKLGDISKDKKKYQGVLKNLILEGAYALNEDKLQVKIRKADSDVAKQAIEEAQKEYKSKVNKDVAITIDESDPLPSESYVNRLLKNTVYMLTGHRSGGAMIVGTGGRIDINNTLEERLRLLESDALPSIRVTLFGENENRKFHD
jgi:V-type H+-transporting ATPase subunit E